jgi:ATP-dependent protease HslVU (ClpYQ) peptidase subunit
MTCIVGVVNGDVITIGGDSAASDDHAWFVSKKEKVFTLSNEYGDEALIGYTTSYRMADLLRYQCELPHIHDKELMQYMVEDFVEEIREKFKEHGYSKIEDSQESGGNFLVGIRDRLFIVYDDFQVNECAENYFCVGCGEQFAMGAMHVLKDSNLSTKERIFKSLEASSKFSNGVSPPFLIKHIDSSEKVKNKENIIDDGKTYSNETED